MNCSFVSASRMEEEAMETENIPKEGPSPLSLHHLCQISSSQQSSTPSPLQTQECARGAGASDTSLEMPYTSPHSQQISMAEYNQQAHYYTQQALRKLKASPEYRKHTMNCHSCGCSWYVGEFSAGCKECGGFAIRRPCPVCDGRCENTWHRNVELSHSTGEAHWDGLCRHADATKLLEDLVHMDNVTNAMVGLKTHEQ